MRNQEPEPDDASIADFGRVNFKQAVAIAAVLAMVGALAWCAFALLGGCSDF